MPTFTEKKALIVDYADLPFCFGQYTILPTQQELFLCRLKKAHLTGTPIWNYLYDRNWFAHIRLPQQMKVCKGIVPQDMSTHEFLETILIPDDLLFVMRMKPDVVVSERMNRQGKITYRHNDFMFYYIQYKRQG